VTDPERLDPTLLAERQRHEVPELDELFLVEVRAHPLHQLVVDTGRVPDEMARVQQGGLLALVEPL
jgi:hypothetical protein